MRGSPRIVGLVAVAVLVVLAAVAYVVVGPFTAEDRGPTTTASDHESRPEPAEEPARSRAPRAKRPRGCETSGGSFEPERIAIHRVARPTSVLSVPRQDGRMAGAPPLTEEAKMLFGWDRGSRRAGSAHGSVALMAHTWPDGSAMGNRLLRDLEKGDHVVLHGANGERACYRLADRVDVPPTHQPTADRFYARDGAPRLAIIVCSGERIGPGEWTHRTVWFGRPVS